MLLPDQLLPNIKGTYNFTKADQTGKHAFTILMFNNYQNGKIVTNAYLTDPEKNSPKDFMDFST